MIQHCSTCSGKDVANFEKSPQSHFESLNHKQYLFKNVISISFWGKCLKNPKKKIDRSKIAQIEYELLIPRVLNSRGSKNHNSLIQSDPMAQKVLLER